MTRVLLLLVAVAGCSSPPPPEAHAPVTMAGGEFRVDSWKAIAVERGHLHGDLSDYPCPLADFHALSKLMPLLAGDDAPSAEKRNASLEATMEQLCARNAGPSYGGSSRLALGLYRFGADPARPVEALIFDFPRLRPDEIERRFQAGEFTAAWERPAKTVAARLERGWVRVRRLNPGDGLLPCRYDFEIFVVLAPAAGGGAPTQIVTRVEAPPQ